MLRDHCYFSLDYNNDIRAAADPEEIVKMDRIIQFPYTALENLETAEDAVARMQEKKREQGRRLQAQAAAVRLQKVCYGVASADGARADSLDRCTADTKGTRSRKLPRP